MEPAAPILEQILIYAGHALCIAGAFYMLKVGEIKVGLALLVGFVLQMQAGILVGLMDSDMEAQGACWASGRSYYECLPIWFRVTIHLGQLGTAMVGVGVFLAAMALRRRRETHNNRLHRINFRCHLLCIGPHKSRHQKFTR